MTYAAVRSYLSSREIPQFFEAMMAGLMYHRPKDHLAYMQRCIQDVQSQTVQGPFEWNAFINNKGKKSGKGDSSHVPRSLYHWGTTPVLDPEKQRVIFVLSESKESIQKVCRRVAEKSKENVQFLEVESLFHERLVVEGFGRWEVVPPCAFVDSVARASSKSDITLVTGFPRHVEDLIEWEAWQLPCTLLFLVPDEQEEISDLEVHRNLFSMFKYCSDDGKHLFLRVTAPEELHNVLKEMSTNTYQHSVPLEAPEITSPTSVLRDMPVICFVGIPGAGKSSQSASAGHKFDMARLNMDELVKQEIQKGENDLSDEERINLLKKTMDSLAPGVKGFILDNFPPTVELGQSFEKEISEFTVILNLHVSKEIAIERQRKEASNQEDGEKDLNAIKKNIEISSNNLTPVLSHFATKVITVSSAGSAAEIFGNVEHVIEGVLELPLDEEEGTIMEEVCVKSKAGDGKCSSQKSIEILRKMDSEVDSSSAMGDLERYVEEVSSDKDLLFEQDSVKEFTESVDEGEMEKSVPGSLEMTKFEPEEALQEIEEVLEKSVQEPVEAATFEIKVPTFPTPDETFRDSVDVEVTDIETEKSKSPEFIAEMIDEEILAAEENVLLAEEPIHEEGSLIDNLHIVEVVDREELEISEQDSSNPKIELVCVSEDAEDKQDNVEVKSSENDEEENEEVAEETEEAEGDTEQTDGETEQTEENVEAGGEAAETADAEEEATEAEGETAEVEGETAEAEGETTEAEGETAEGEGETAEAEEETAEADGETAETEGEAAEETEDAQVENLAEGENEEATAGDEDANEESSAQSEEIAVEEQAEETEAKEDEPAEGEEEETGEQTQNNEEAGEESQEADNPEETTQEAEGEGDTEKGADEENDDEGKTPADEETVEPEEATNVEEAPEGEQAEGDEQAEDNEAEPTEETGEKEENEAEDPTETEAEEEAPKEEEAENPEDETENKAAEEESEPKDAEEENPEASEDQAPEEGQEESEQKENTEEATEEESEEPTETPADEEEA